MAPPLPPPLPRRPGRLSRAAYGVFALVGACAGYLAIKNAAPPISDNRIAILPFRTTGADSSLAFLADGLVELLALELKGDIGPAAVDAGETLRAWRNGGGSESQAAAVRVSRSLGAGHLTDGAVVGTPARFTVTLSVLRVDGTRSRDDAITVEGSAESLPALVGTLASRLLAPYAGARASELANVNPAALRSYVAGMVEYRKANWSGAGTALYHAFELDSTFVPAAFQFGMVHALIAPTTPFGAAPTRDPRLTRLYSLLWKGRQHLSANQRVLLAAVTDSLYVLWHQQQLPRLERAVTLLPNSPEVWELLGDAYYHGGALLGHEDWPDRAKQAFARALAIDSTIAVSAAGHLADIAFSERDARAFDHYSHSAHDARRAACRRYQAALLRGIPSVIHTARGDYARAWARGEDDGLDWAFGGLTVPAAELDSLIGAFTNDATTEPQQRLAADWQVDAAALTGRPRRAMAAMRTAPRGSDTLAVYSALTDWAEGDSVAAERVASYVNSLGPGRNKVPRPLACNAALSRLRRGDTTGVAGILATEPPLDGGRPVLVAVTRVRRGLVAQAAICGEVLRGVLASVTSASPTLLLRADTLMRHMPLNYADFWNYDLAVAFARRGDYAHAAAAARRRMHDVRLAPLPRLALTLRQEGRWAALAGDRQAAIKAYRQYLLWRAAPEAVLVAQRDSVRDELATLLRPQLRSFLDHW